MFKKRIGLNEEERVIKIVRRSLWHWFWPIILAAVLIFLPFFLIYPLFQMGQWGILIFAAILLIGLLFALRIFLSYYFTALVMTGARLIDLEQNGFFAYAASALLYSKIQDATCQTNSIFSALTKTGDIYISFVGNEKEKLKLIAIKNPRQAVSDILFQQEEFFKERRQQSEQKARFLLAKIKRKVGTDEFNRLISD